MTYKKKAALLLILILCLIISYAVTFLCDPEVKYKNSNLVWLENRYVSLADRIEIYGIAGKTVLIKKNNVWVISDGPAQYPAKQTRVEELFRDLSRRKNYPLRSSASEYERFGVGDGANRIVIMGGAGLPLLDLLIGYADASGKELFLRKQGSKEIRSGEDIFTIYTDSDKQFWYDLRIFAGLQAASVQKIHLFPAGAPESLALTGSLTLCRRNNQWVNEITGSVVVGAESWLRSILDIQGQDFINTIDFNTEERIVMELGDGSTCVLRIGPPDASGDRAAAITGSGFSYILSEWTMRRIWDFYKLGIY